MTNVEPSFVLYALLLDPGCCLRAHIVLIELIEPEKKKERKKEPRQGHEGKAVGTAAPPCSTPGLPWHWVSILQKEFQILLRM
jgi:hypothetical protein